MATRAKNSFHFLSAGSAAVPAGAVFTGFLFAHSGGTAGDAVRVKDDNGNTVFYGKTTAEADGVITSPGGMTVRAKKIVVDPLSNGELIAYHK